MARRDPQGSLPGLDSVGRAGLKGAERPAFRFGTLGSDAAGQARWQGATKVGAAWPHVRTVEKCRCHVSRGEQLLLSGEPASELRRIDWVKDTS